MRGAGPRTTLRHRGVVRCSTPIPWDSPGPVNTYVVLGPPHVLIDPGFAGSWPLLRRELDTAGVALSDVGLVLLTHGHQDHCSALEAALRACPARAAIHSADAPKLAPDYLEAKAAQVERLAAWYASEGVDADGLATFLARLRDPARHRPRRALPVDEVEDGQRVGIGDIRLRVVWTPGHSAGHVVYHLEDRGVAFCGDHLLDGISPNPVLEFDAGDRRLPSMGDYLTSLDRVLELPVDLWCPGHGPLVRDAVGLVASLREFLERRQLRILELLDDGELTAFALADRLFPGAGPLDRFLAFSEVLGQIDELERRGRVRFRRQGGMRLVGRA